MTKAAAGRAPERSPGNGPGTCLGFQWDAASWETAARLWDTLFGWLGERPAFWNLPTFPEDSSVRKRAAPAKPLLARVEARGEVVTSAGFSGACHPLLNMNELDREVTWGLRNPWGTGVADVLGMRPRILVPRVADLARGDAWKVYRDRGFSRVGICVREAGRPPDPPDGCLAFLRVPVAAWFSDTARSRSLRRAVMSRPAALLLLDLCGCSDPAFLRSVLEDPSGLFGGRSPSLSPLPEIDGDLPPHGSGASLGLDWAPFCIPDLHAVLEATAAASRKRRRKNEEMSALLAALGTPRDGLSQAQAPKRSYQPQLVAHMLGDVTLGGSAFDVRLHGGRFCGIVRQGIDLMPLRPASSFFRVGRSLSPLRTVSSVSFESDAGTGLQEELGMDGRDGTLLRIEYSFRDDSPDLSILLDMEMPPLPAGSRVEEYAPLALALRLLRKEEEAAIEVSAPDGSASSFEVSERNGSVLAPGAEHRVRRPDGGWIVLRFSTPAGPSWGLPSFRVVRARRQRVLEVNPFGSYAPVPSRALAGRASFRMTLGIA
jgi:hypothetical protein